MKKGRLSKSEMKYIADNAPHASPENIAAHLDRDPETIKKYINTKLTTNKDNVRESDEVDAEYDLKSREFWKVLKKQFSKDELETFIYHWKRLIAQFRRDVLPTEELQVIELIRFEILANRCLVDLNNSKKEVEKLEEWLRTEENKHFEVRDIELVTDLSRQIGSLRAGRDSLSKEYRDIEDKKNKLFSSLKATREQRIKKLENTKETFDGLIRKILRDPEFVAEQNMYLEKMRLALEQEEKRLGDYHEFEDGEVDRPLLTPETVMWEGEKPEATNKDIEEDDDSNSGSGNEE